MGEPKNLHFYDFGIYGRPPSPKPTIFISGDTRTHKTNQETNRSIFTIIMFPIVWQFWGRRAPTKDDDASNKLLKILDMGSISIKEHEMEHEMEFRYILETLIETNKPRISETKKVRIFETKNPWNQETKKH